MADNFKHREEIFKKSGILYLFILVFALLIILRLLQLNIFQKEKWERVVRTYSLDFKPGNPERGDIYDENGNLLATTVSYFDIHMDTRSKGMQDTTFNNNIDKLAKALSEYFKDKSTQEYKKYIVDARNKKIRTKSGRTVIGDSYLPIAISTSYSTVEALRNFPIFKYGVFAGGFIVEKRNVREKLLGKLLRRTIGSVSDETENEPSYGNYGLEYTYNRYLSGVPGLVLKRKISNGKWMEVPGGKVIQTEDGVDLITSIDIDLQDFAHRTLAEQILKYKAHHGTVVVMEVKTGHIKAIANLTMTKDSNLISDRNYAVDESVEPGSTFKLPVIIAALEDKLIEINDTVDTGNGYTEFFGKPVIDEGTYGKIPVWKVFSKSSNVGMAKIVFDNYYSKNTAENLLTRFGNMGLHETSGIDIDGEASPYINDPASGKWWKGSAMMISHGYEVQFTPIQILTLYNAVANNGKMLKPSVVKAISRHGQIIKIFKDKEKISSVCSKETLKDVKFMLEKAVSEDGTAKELGKAKYKIAGKTGTAKIFDLKSKSYTEYNRTSFVGYFPADNPKYSCIVVIHKPEGKYMYGSNVAAPVFKKIADKIYSKDFEINPPQYTNLKGRNFIEVPVSKNGFKPDLDYIFSSLNIGTQQNSNTIEWVNTETQKNSVKYNNKYIKKEIVPDVKYMGARDAVFLLESAGLNVTVSGKGFVYKQSLAPGTSFNKGQKIFIELI